MHLLLTASGSSDFLNFHESAKFVAGAYIVVLAVILIYVAIMAKRLSTSQRELAELRRLVERRNGEPESTTSQSAEPAEQTAREAEQV